MTSEASNPNYDQVYARLNERETDDLLKIWEENDRNMWTETAFQAIHNILQERLGSVPPQKEAPPKKITRARPLIKSDRIISLSAFANNLAWIVLVGFILAWLVSLSASFAGIALLFGGLFLFIGLRILAEGLLLLLAIYENISSEV
jgi:hypothetical protein